MNIKFKSITTALIAAGLSLSVMTFDPIFSEPTTVEAATAQQKKAKKIKKIKADHRKKIAKAKRIQVRKNNAAKAVKANDKQLKKLNGQKRAQQNKVKSLNKTISEKQKGIPKAKLSSDVKNPSKIYNTKHRITRDEQLPTTLARPHHKVEYFENQPLYYGYVATGADKSAKINGNPTAAQQKELADYGVTLINSYLRSKGLPAASWSSQMQAQTQTAVKKRDVSLSWSEFFPETKGLNYYSHMTVNFHASGNSMLAMKVAILNTLTNNIYNAGPWLGYSFQNTIDDASGNQAGFVIERNREYDREKFPYRMTVLTAKDNGRVYQNNQRLTSTSKHASKKASAKKEIAARNAANKKIATLNKQIKSRNASLNRAMKKKFKANNAQFNKSKKQADRVMKKQLRRV